MITEPAPLELRPLPSVGMATVVRVHPDITSACPWPAGLDETTLAALHALHALARPMSVIELAARLDEPIVSVCVSVHELLARAQVQMLPGPIPLRERLRAWTRSTGQPDRVQVDTLVLVSSAPQDGLNQALGQITDTGPLPVETHLPGRMWVGLSRPDPSHHVVVIAVAGLNEDDPRWADVCRHASAALVVLGERAVCATTGPAAVPGLRALIEAQLPVVAMTAPTPHGETDPDPDLVRAVLGVPADTPVVAGDYRLAADLHTAIGACPC